MKNDIRNDVKSLVVYLKCHNIAGIKLQIIKLGMDILNETELSQLLGGGYWWKDTNGDWHYSPDDEIPDGDDIICG